MSKTFKGCDKHRRAADDAYIDRAIADAKRRNRNARAARRLAAQAMARGDLLAANKMQWDARNEYAIASNLERRAICEERGDWPSRIVQAHVDPTYDPALR